MADIAAIVQGAATGITVAFVIWREYGRSKEKDASDKGAHGGTVTVTLPDPPPPRLPSTVELDEIRAAIELLQRASVQNQRAIAQNKRDADADIGDIRTNLAEFSGEVAERILKLTAKIAQMKRISP